MVKVSCGLAGKAPLKGVYRCKSIQSHKVQHLVTSKAAQIVPSCNLNAGCNIEGETTEADV
jgi:hypothetical protein